jgi:hypothetical protein
MFYSIGFSAMPCTVPKSRLSQVDFAKAESLKQLRDVAHATTAKTTVSIEVKADPANQRFKLIAVEYQTAIRLEHPVPWFVPRSVMIEECISRVRTIEVEAGLEAKQRLVKQGPMPKPKGC